jgi:hypothetical protein
MFSLVVSLGYDPGLVPQTKDTVTLPAVPREVRLPLSVTEVLPIPVAALVVTAGGVRVLK